MPISEPRATEDSMVAILGELDDDSHDVTPFIASATTLVDRIAAADSTVADDVLESIESWLACHFYKASFQNAKMEKAGPVSETKDSWVNYGLQTTMWGSQAIMLDPTGTLANINESAKDAKASRKPSLSFVGGKANRRLNNT